MIFCQISSSQWYPNLWINLIVWAQLLSLSLMHSTIFGFTHGIVRKWTYFLTTPKLVHHLHPLKDSIRSWLLPALTAQEAFDNDLCSLISLPAKLGGMGIINPFAIAGMQYQSSVTITAPLTSLIVHLSSETIIPVLLKVSNRKKIVKGKCHS